MNAICTEDPLMKITPRPEPVMLRGEGSWLWDNRGKRYLDFIQGWAVNALGHCPRELIETLDCQARTLITPSPALHNRPQLELARALTAEHFAQAHFANSGAEANEAAVKLARRWGQLHRAGAFEVITARGAFHGRTLAMMAASGKAGWDVMFPPSAPGFVHVPFGNADAVAAAISDRTVAIMVEPIQGEAGVIVPPAGYLRALRQLADEHGLLLIFDEVQTGIGRTGYLFYHQHPEVQALPDIMTLGKGLGAGVPLSAVLATQEAACFDYGNQGGTYNGNPLTTAVGLRVVNTVRSPGFLDEVRARGDYLRTLLEAVAGKAGLGTVEGRGLLQAIHLEQPVAQQIADEAFERGLIVNPAQPRVLRLMPSLRVSTEEIAQMGEILRSATAALS